MSDDLYMFLVCSRYFRASCLPIFSTCSGPYMFTIAFAKHTFKIKCVRKLGGAENLKGSALPADPKNMNFEKNAKNVKK